MVRILGNCLCIFLPLSRSSLFIQTKKITTNVIQETLEETRIYLAKRSRKIVLRHRNPIRTR